MARPQVIFLSASFKYRVCGLIRDGMCRYAAARRWDVRSMSWNEALAGALRETPDGRLAFIANVAADPETPAFLYEIACQ